MGGVQAFCGQYPSSLSQAREKGMYLATGIINTNRVQSKDLQTSREQSKQGNMTRRSGTP